MRVWPLWVTGGWGYASHKSASTKVSAPHNRGTKGRSQVLACPETCRWRHISTFISSLWTGVIVNPTCTGLFKIHVNMFDWNCTKTNTRLTQPDNAVWTGDTVYAQRIEYFKIQWQKENTGWWPVAEIGLLTSWKMASANQSVQTGLVKL